MRLFLTIVIIIMYFSTTAQDISNIRVYQHGKKVIVQYDLLGIDSYIVYLYYSINNSSWKGPLKKVSGDIIFGQKQGVNKKIVWSPLEEGLELQGEYQFQIKAQLNKDFIDNKKSLEMYQYKLKNSRKYRNRSLAILGICSASLAVHFQLEEEEAFYDASLVVGLFSILGLWGFIDNQGEINNYKRQLNKLSFYPIPVKNGAGVRLAFSF